MSDEHTRQRRTNKFKTRNRHAQSLREDAAFRIRRVEDKHKLHERLSTREWMKRVIEKDDDDE
jgi:hypothetical protein